jgi:CheY-like chemotaxis protein
MIRKIFMVDDDADDRALFQQAVHTLDPSIELSFANNGDDAFKYLLTAARPDAIFLDCIMPGMDGIECLTKLKSNRSTRQIPVIMYTGSMNKIENELVIRLGAFQLLPKTSHADELASEIKQIIKFLEKF